MVGTVDEDEAERLERRIELAAGEEMDRYRKNLKEIGRILPEDAPEMNARVNRPPPAPALPAVSPDRALLFAHGIINSALYIAGVFIAGLVWDHRFAVILALVTAALCYLGAFAQLTVPVDRRLAIILVGAAIVSGAWAGISLLSYG